jgi:hypothetical protein
MEQIIEKVDSIPAEVIRKIDDLNKQAWEVHVTEPKQGL